MKESFLVSVLTGFYCLRMAEVWFLTCESDAKGNWICYSVDNLE